MQVLLVHEKNAHGRCLLPALLLQTSGPLNAWVYPVSCFDLWQDICQIRNLQSRFLKNSCLWQDHHLKSPLKYREATTKCLNFA